MNVVVQHLLDVVVVDPPPVADVVAAGESGTGHGIAAPAAVAGKPLPGDQVRHSTSLRNPLVPLRAGRTTPLGNWRNSERRIGGPAKGAVHPGCGPGRQTSRPAKDALLPGLGVATGKAEWGLAKDAVRPGCEFAGDCRVREKERNAVRPVATWSATKLMETALQDQASGPSPLASRPEHVETAVPLPLFNSCAADVREADGANCLFRPQLEESAKRAIAPPVLPMG